VLGEKSIHGVSDSLLALEFTGERIVPGKTPEILFREHEERYAFAAQYVAGKDVLDIACGTGIGTDHLRKTGAACCYGVDIDPMVVEYAKTAYENCIFLRADATRLSLPDNSMDLVVSMETIEHVLDQQKFLLECKRVLRPNGRFICSTPNRIIYRWQGQNPFHVRELTADEFASLIAAHFGNVRLFSQSERIYLLYVLRKLAARSLDRLKLRAVVTSVLGLCPTATRLEFSRVQGLSQLFKPYRRRLFAQPMFLIAVGNKVASP
jgi:2-polyprenyl-3-methyl-5-hydroxy-6-metoxy-1,4-benzoquinol methylase